MAKETEAETVIFPENSDLNNIQQNQTIAIDSIFPLKFHQVKKNKMNRKMLTNQHYLFVLQLNCVRKENRTYFTGLRSRNRYDTGFGKFVENPRRFGALLGRWHSIGRLNQRLRRHRSESTIKFNFRERYGIVWARTTQVNSTLLYCLRNENENSMRREA